MAAAVLVVVAPLVGLRARALALLASVALARLATMLVPVVPVFGMKPASGVAASGLAVGPVAVLEMR